DIESSPVERAEGRAAPYQVTFPKGRWYPRKPAAAARDNPIADRWFMRPDRDAHILVVAESAPGQPLPIDAYVDAVPSNLRGTAEVDVCSREPWPAYPDAGRLVKVRGKHDGIAFEWHYALVTAYERAFYLVGFATQETMPSVQAEIREIFDTFRVPPALLA